MVSGREQMCFYFWPDSGGRLQEGVSRGAEKIREGGMEGDRISRF